MKAILLPALATLGVFTAPAGTVPAPTLLSITNANPPPARLTESIVIIIDAQREYVDGRLPLTGVADALRQTQRLLQRADALVRLPRGIDPTDALCDSTYAGSGNTKCLTWCALCRLWSGTRGTYC